MEIKEIKTIDGLTRNSVSIMTRKMVEINGDEQQLGDNQRISYVNDEFGRKELLGNESIEVINAVMAIWGEEPTIHQSETEIETEIETETHDELSE